MYQICRHIMSSGARCASPSLQGTPYCYYHTRQHKVVKTRPAPADGQLQLPILEDRSAVQLALSQVLSALASEKLDPKRAGLFLYGLQIASQNVERQYDIVPITAVQSMTHDADGEELAPEQRFCERPEDCVACREKEHCRHYLPTRRR